MDWTRLSTYFVKQERMCLWTKLSLTKLKKVGLELASFTVGMLLRFYIMVRKEPLVDTTNLKQLVLILAPPKVSQNALKFLFDSPRLCLALTLTLFWSNSKFIWIEFSFDRFRYFFLFQLIKIGSWFGTEIRSLIKVRLCPNFSSFKNRFFSGSFSFTILSFGCACQCDQIGRFIGLWANF